LIGRYILGKITGLVFVQLYRIAQYLVERKGVV